MLDADGLMRQAPSTASYYMIEGKTRIDSLFGEGYAKENPELLTAFMQTCALDFQAMQLAPLKEIENRMEWIAQAIANLD